MSSMLFVFALVFGFMLLVMASMAIGVIMGRKPISGSCGGMKALGMDVECEICGGNPQLCETAPRTQGGSSGRLSDDAGDLSHDASNHGVRERSS